MEIYEIKLHSMVYGGIFHVSQNRNATHQISLQSKKVAVGNVKKINVELSIYSSAQKYCKLKLTFLKTTQTE